MFFEGQLSIDPSKLTQIERIKPEGAFRKFLYAITGGAIADKLERETFTAVSILQQLHNILKVRKVNNVIRLAHDDQDFYFDTEGKADDLDETISNYRLEINEAMSTHFEQLLLVVEHEDESFKYLIEAEINRSHKVGEYPITVKVDGLLKDFKAREGEDAELMQERMSAVFSSQEAYDNYRLSKSQQFESFLAELKMAIQTYMKVDDVTLKHKTKLVLNPDKGQTRQQTQPRPVTAGVPHRGLGGGYYGFGDFIFYTMLWGTMTHSNHIHIHDVDVVNDSGDLLTSIDEGGIDAAEAGMFDPDVDYSDRMGMAEDMGFDGGDFGGGDFDFDGGFDGFDFGGFDF